MPCFKGQHQPASSTHYLHTTVNSPLCWPMCAACFPRKCNESLLLLFLLCSFSSQSTFLSVFMTPALGTATHSDRTPSLRKTYVWPKVALPTLHEALPFPRHWFMHLSTPTMHSSRAAFSTRKPRPYNGAPTWRVDEIKMSEGRRTQATATKSKEMNKVVRKVKSQMIRVAASQVVQLGQPCLSAKPC